jgi:hypothetical protein
MAMVIQPFSTEAIAEPGDAESLIHGGMFMANR